jgi:uncharacterized protein
MSKNSESHPMTRTMMFVVFFSIIVTIYSLVNSYIFFRGLSAFPSGSPYRAWFIGVFLFLASSYIAARLLERLSCNVLSNILVWIGSYWLGAMAYFILILLTIDIFRLLHYVVPFFPAFITRDIIATKQISVLVVTILVGIVLLGARLNAMFPQLQVLEMSIPKLSPLKELNVALVSDVHLGNIICNSHLTRIVNKINELNPDIVLIAGDLVDEDIQPVIRRNLGETLRQIKSKYGVYGITGNHEYIGGVEPACKYLTEHGVVMLRDSTVEIANAFTLVGREDVSIRQFSGRQRKPLADLMKPINKSLPVLLMDHQPLHLSEAVENGADLQVSGHTHHGQLWPFNFISKAVYELSWGYLKKAQTHFYVSCGVGTWGPPMRTGNRPEVVNLKLKFEPAR